MSGNAAISGLAEDLNTYEDEVELAAPNLTGPNGATGPSSSVAIYENSTLVGVFTADEPISLWSFAGGEDEAHFIIDKNTGELSFASAPDYEVPADVGSDNVYQVTVMATDADGYTAVQDVSVSVLDVDETRPEPELMAEKSVAAISAPGELVADCATHQPSAEAGPLESGICVEYMIILESVIANSEPASGVVIKDTLPPGMASAAVTGSVIFDEVNIDGSTITARIASMAWGARAIIQVRGLLR